MTQHSESAPQSSAATRVTLRGPAELVESLPYLLGYHPDDSIVLVGLHGPGGRFGGRLRAGIPAGEEAWAETAGQLADCLRGSAAARGGTPDGVLLFLCQDPVDGGGRAVMERLRPLAQLLRTACGALDMPVYEALCVSGGRYWSYCCPDSRCCPDEGTPLESRGTPVIAAAAAYAGVRVAGSLKELTARLAPLGPPVAEPQEQALDLAGTALVPRLLGDADRRAVRTETIALARRLLDRYRSVPAGGRGVGEARADARDDGLLSHEEAAALILGLQDRVTRDWAAEWMEGEDAAPALRLWRALARRCVGAYAEHAAAPLTLAGWVAWSGGDQTGARVALGRALETDPEYLFARLLHSACGSGIDPEPLRECLRRQRAERDLGAPVVRG
ncbi:DUF4192 domain-containing protein [Streptomyces sp. TRM 70361]|uniref:DUF4192 domain-containing protein n=1 Tax=Streptomyces sp. TRM 70361 TaxID=3116553 RepID=UPI002E7C22E6|nr:DUF4192 domain-containing protein [Streptomyces sp. TRM 70361]MEE1940908.1 DUF4192 domain-containing protein [Streptomyces sp. TRM 70361]